MMIRLLLVDDDVSTTETLGHDLRRQGFDVNTLCNGTQVMGTWHRGDIVLLNLDLTDIDGLEICRRLRTQCEIPIIGFSTRDTELDKVLGLQAGLDDYLTEPYGFRELLARIDAVMRRASPKLIRKNSISHGPLHIDLRARRVCVHDALVCLTRKEYDLLALLASQPESVVSRREIMAKVWNDRWTGFSRTIDTHVSSLRAKLGDQSWILTIRGVGFQLGNSNGFVELTDY